MPNNDRLLSPLEIQWDIYQNPSVKFNISTKYPKIHKEPQRLQIAKLILRGKNTARGNLRFDIITSYSCSHEDNLECSTSTHSYQWGKTADLETNGEIRGHLIFDKDDRNKQLKKDSLVYKWYWYSWASLCRGITLDPIFPFTFYKKNQFETVKKNYNMKA